MLRIAVPCSLLLAGALAAGCGSSSGSGSGGGLASKSPKAIQAEAARALGAAKSFHVDGTGRDADGPSRLVADIGADGRARITLTQKGGTVAILVLGATTYVKADAAYWRTQGGADGEQLARLLGGRWAKVPAAQSGSITREFQDIQPRTLAHCLATQPTGKVTKAGSAKVGDQDVVVLAEDGKAPGASPGKLSVATSGPAYPLRVVQTGKATPGGPKDPRCSDHDDTTIAEDDTFSAFDAPLALKAPPHALDLDKLQSQGSGAATA